MRLLSWLLSAAAAIISVASSEENGLARTKRDSPDKKIVCYYTNWSVYRPGTAKFSPQNINPYLCTHLIYAFGGLSKDNALKPFDKYQDIEQGGYAKFNGLKTYNKNLKTMLAIGGWNEGSARFSPLVADAERRKELVKNTVKFLRQNHFDGLDLDWEYPSFRDGGKPRDRDNYATLVQEFREEFERESEKTGRTRLLLTMAVPAGIEYIDKGYDVPRLNKYLDWMNILSYDYHSAFEPAINHHSPLFSLEEDNEYNFDAQLSIDYTVKHYIKLGADKSKLVLGIPTYGRSYTLFNPDATDIGSPADGPGEQGEATREKGYLAYYEICERVSKGGWTEENPYPDAMGPYAYKDNQWVGYDDENIARAKAKYVNDNDLGGIMFWSIDNDDFRGKCHGKPYPIIEAAKEALLASANELVPSNVKSNSKNQKQSSPKSKTRNSRVRTKSTTTTEASKVKTSGRTTTTPQPPTTPDPGSDFVCKDEGFFPHPRDCKKYFWCLDSGPSSLGIVAHQFTCPSGLVFNKISDSCDYARNVICKNKGDSTTTTTSTTPATTTSTTTTAKTTTVRSRLVITASPPRTTSSTTTESPEEEEEEEEEDVEGEEEDEEDPGTIKELINLIKKLGGVEQLEKQLNLQNIDAKEKIKPSLYSKVLQGRTGNKYRGVTGDDSTTTKKYQSLFRNRPIGTQVTESDESNFRNQDKPKYVTIQRNRSTKKPIDYKEDSVEEEEEEIEVKVQPKSSKSSRIRTNLDSATEKEYVTLRRFRPTKSEEELTTTSRYRNVVRVRSTTEAPLEEEEEEEELAEDDEEVEEEEDDGGRDREDEEDEVTDEDFDSLKKFKKYPSVTRGKKISSAAAAEEEEVKVSDPHYPHGADYEDRIQQTTTERIRTFHGKDDDVNTVHKATSPRYVEIRRTLPPVPIVEPPTKNNVNIVHNSLESKQATDRGALENESLVTKKLGGFQPRSTTVFETSTRPSFRSSVTETVATLPDVLEFTKKKNEYQRFRGTTTSKTSTENPPTTDTKSLYSRYKTINRSNTNNHSTNNIKSPSRYPNKERSTITTTTTTTTATVPLTNSSTTKTPRRFPFAPRNKPTVLEPKVLQSTTSNSFAVTLPNLPGSHETEFSSSFPWVTLEPTTNVPPVLKNENSDERESDELENNFKSTGFVRTRPSTRFYIPTTSTQTTVVTSITESQFTERGRIWVPKRNRGSISAPDGKFVRTTTTTTVKPTEQTSRSSFKSTKTTPSKSEGGRRFRGKSATSTTTTTEQTVKQNSRYVPKKTRSYKRIVTSEAPETTTARQRFAPRKKFRPTSRNSNEVLNSGGFKTNSFRNKKVTLDLEENDLDLEQSDNYFRNKLAGTYYSGERGRQVLGRQEEKDASNTVVGGPTKEGEDSFETEEEKNSDESRATSTEEPQTNFRFLRTKTLPKNDVEPKLTTLAQFFGENRTPGVAYRKQTYFPFNLSGSKETIQNGVNASGSSQPNEEVKNVTETFDLTKINETKVDLPFKPNRITKAIATNSTRFSNVISRNQEGLAKNKETTLVEVTTVASDEVSGEVGTETVGVSFTGSLEASEEQSKEVTTENLTVPTISKSETSSNIATSLRIRLGRTRIKKNNFTESTLSKIVSTTDSGIPSSNETNEVSENLLKKKKFFRLLPDRIRKPLTNVTSKNDENRITDSSQSNLKSSNNVNELNVNDTVKFRNFRKFKLGIRRLEPATISSTTERALDNDEKDQTVTTTQRPRIRQFVRRIKLSNGQRPKSKNEFVEETSTPGRTSTGLEESKLISEVSYDTTYGVRTEVFNEATKSLSDRVASTETPTTLGLFFRNSVQPIEITDSVISSSIDSAVRVSNDPSTGPVKYETVQRIPSESTVPTTRSETDNEVPTYWTSSESDPPVTKQPQKPKPTDVSDVKVNSTRWNFRAFKTRKTFPKVSETSNEVDESKNGKTRDKVSKNGKRVLVRTRLIRPSENLEADGRRRKKEKQEDQIKGGGDQTTEDDGGGEDVETEVATPPSSLITTTTTTVTPVYFSSRKINQDLVGTRNRVRSTTTQAPTTEKKERRRTLLDRRRLKQNTIRSTTVKPEIISDTYSSTVRTNVLRRRTRPTTTSTTTSSTTTTTETPYYDTQDDSSLEESKLDGAPGIQDLADPAVVAIHTLATIAPGSISSSGRPLTYFGAAPAVTSDTYTVHVTPADIESITPGRVATIAPGTVRPTSILTLKPFTIPVITKTPAQSNPITLRPPSPFRANGISLATEEPYISRDDILEQARRLEVISQPRPLPSVTASTSQKALTAKSPRPKPFSKVPKQEVVQSVSPPDPQTDYEYYDEEDPLANIPASALKVKVHSNGYIECLDRGNFPHPFSCKKFISCAKMENNELLGWEYTCPKHLSFDPVGGICNWSAGLGCQH